MIGWNEQRRSVYGLIYTITEALLSLIRLAPVKKNDQILGVPVLLDHCRNILENHPFQRDWFVKL